MKNLFSILGLCSVLLFNSCNSKAQSENQSTKADSISSSVFLVDSLCMAVHHGDLSNYVPRTVKVTLHSNLHVEFQHSTGETLQITPISSRSVTEGDFQYNQIYGTTNEGEEVLFSFIYNKVTKEKSIGLYFHDTEDTFFLFHVQYTLVGAKEEISPKPLIGETKG